jgi:hypothetical protein
MLLLRRRNPVAFFTTKSGSIVGAAVIAIALVGGAYYLSSGKTAQVNAASTEDILKAYAAKDTDGDGLPDWEEALYGTDPNNPDTFHLGMTDAEAVQKGLVKLKIDAPSAPAAATSSLAAGIPGPTAASTTLTDQFAQAFFNNYISTRGSQPPTADQAAQFVQGAVANLVATQVRPDAYAASDIRVSGSGPAALQAYAAAAQTALSTHSANVQYDELTYLQDAVQKNDQSSIVALKSIASSYTQNAQALAAVPVPSEAASAQLALVNAIARMGATINDMAAIQSDPILALVALGNYAADAQELGMAFSNMHAVFALDGVSLDAAAPGGRFYLLTESSAALVASSTPVTP